MAKSRPIKSADVPAYSSPSNGEKRKKITPSVADLHGTDVKNNSAAVKSTEPRTRVQVRTLSPPEAQTLKDTVSIRGVKLISTLLAGASRPPAAGWSDGVTYEEGQDRGVRRAE